jgi:RNA polymerase sigma-70 factor, ECF subfamily
VDEPSGTRSREGGRLHVYCLVPPGTPSAAADQVRQAAERNVEVLVDRRRSERRRQCDRRTRAEAERSSERRRIHNREGRRAGERRAPLVPIRFARDTVAPGTRGVTQATFVERRARSTQEVEDLETARLVIDLQAGKPAAFDEIYERYVSRVYRYMRIALGDAHEAEDAAHEIFVKLLDALPSYELRAVPFRIWLFRIVRNYTINHLRKHRRVHVMAPEQINRRLEDGPGLPESAAVMALNDGELLRLIGCLPAAQRQVIVLRYVMDFDVAEVGRILGRSPNAVSMLQQRAFATLRARLGGQSPETRSVRLPMSRHLREAVVTASRRLALTY